MRHFRPVSPGPISPEDAASLNEALLELGRLSGGFSAAPPLTVQDDAGGVRYLLETTDIAKGDPLEVVSNVCPQFDTNGVLVGIQVEYTTIYLPPGSVQTYKRCVVNPGGCCDGWDSSGSGYSGGGLLSCCCDGMMSTCLKVTTTGFAAPYTAYNGEWDCQYVAPLPGEGGDKWVYYDGTTTVQILCMCDMSSYYNYPIFRVDILRAGGTLLSQMVYPGGQVWGNQCPNPFIYTSADFTWTTTPSAGTPHSTLDIRECTIGGGGGGSGIAGGVGNCCPDGLPATIYAHFTNAAGCLALDGYTAALTWNGAQWQLTDNPCGLAMIIGFKCAAPNPGAGPNQLSIGIYDEGGVWTWTAADPAGNSCSPLNALFSSIAVHSGTCDGTVGIVVTESA